MIIIDLLGKGLWGGFAAIGFAVLFNVPKRVLLPIWIMAAIAIMLKFIGLHFGLNIILSTFIGSTAVGIMVLYSAHKYYAPPLVFSIASVIPMIPGAFAYNTMLGLMDLATITDKNEYIEVLSYTASNGTKALFLLMSLAIGVALPMLIARKESIKVIEHSRH